MDFITAIKTCFSKYADFNGRARRSEFWYWYLFTILVSMFSSWIPFASLVMLALVIPTLAAAVRRLHDIGRSGWWVLLNVVPSIICFAFLIALLGSAIITLIAAGTYEPEMLIDNLSANIGLCFAYVLSALASFVCSIVLIVWWAKDSAPGANEYGENPKGVETK